EMWERGIVTGTTPTTFAPNDTLTRAAAVTLLYRLDGMIDTGLDANFSDVCCCAWYHDAVAWAASLGIVQGVGDNQFAPGGDMTREAMAVMLWRYAATTGQDVTVPEDFTLDFADVAEVSVWATEAMYWAVYRGIMRGTDGWRLNPLGTATRAEAAVLLQRFVNLTQ
ncbi:MAG: S-layer homology domain-containing protein, partial [Oscillospiraceae bacterium]|nr:S-layer homology domain-containing protein [Oscillospiraceae bacterium]